jgi:hypothetical protein
MENFYRTQFALRYNHNWSFTEQNEMVPWEREIFLAMLQTKIEEEEAEYKKRGLLK